MICSLLYNCLWFYTTVTLNLFTDMINDEKEFLIQFGKRLASLRKSKGLSQEELANRSGLHAVAITYIETGKRLPKLNTIHKLATGLGVSVETLFKDL